MRRDVSIVILGLVLSLRAFAAGGVFTQTASAGAWEASPSKLKAVAVLRMHSLAAARCRGTQAVLLGTPVVSSNPYRVTVRGQFRCGSTRGR